eukprot:sb/3472242/
MNYCLALTLLAVLANTGLVAGGDDVNCVAETSCKLCINGTLSGKCAWCDADSKCLPYNPITDINTLEGCSTDKFYASNCIIDHNIVLIGVGIAVGLVAIAAAVLTLWCCCCRGRKARKRKLADADAEYQARMDEISSKHDTLREERQAKNDAIRQKYGLQKSSPYERFE